MTGHAEVPQEDVPGYMLAGYNSVLKLPQAEKNALRICIAARMVMSLVYGAYTYYLDPTNEYVLETAKFGWKALAQFWEADEQKLQDRWDEIINEYESKWYFAKDLLSLYLPFFTKKSTTVSIFKRSKLYV